jgi:hypothetical protein
MQKTSCRGQQRQWCHRPVARADHDQWNYVTPNGGSRVRCLWSSAVLHDDIPAVLEVARFPADGNNRTALQSAQGCPFSVSAGQAA